MDPFTIAFVASTAFNVVKGFQTGEMQKEATSLNRQIAELNTMNAEHDAYESIRIGYAKKAAYESKVNQVLASQTNAYAYADVDTSFGTAQQIQDQSRLNGRFNALDITNAAYSTAMGYKRQALNYRLGGDLKQAEVNGQVNANNISSVIQAGAKFGLAYDKLNFGGGDSSAVETGLNYWSTGKSPSEISGLSLSDQSGENALMGLRL